MTSVETVSYIIEWDEFDNHDALQACIANYKPSVPTTYLANGYTSKSDRRIAGNKRVAQFRETQGVRGTGRGHGQVNVEVLQSITANPGLCHSSFEELRAECYSQCLVAHGRRPSPVDAVSNPHAVIPPMFNAFKVVDRDEEASDVVMQEYVRD